MARACCPCGWETPDQMTDLSATKTAAERHERLYIGHSTEVEEGNR